MLYLLQPVNQKSIFGTRRRNVGTEEASLLAACQSQPPVNHSSPALKRTLLYGLFDFMDKKRTKREVYKQRIRPWWPV